MRNYLLLQNLKLKVTKYINFRLTMWYAISELHIFGTYNCFPRNLADNLISGSFFLPESVSQLWVLLTIYFWKDRKNVLKLATDFYPYIKLYLFRQIATFFLYIASKHRRPSINVMQANMNFLFFSTKKDRQVCMLSC